MIADPGFQLSKEASNEGFSVTSAPGPSAVIAALTVAGLPTDRFLFAGFAPTAKGARAAWLSELSRITATVVFYESPKRIQRMLTELVESHGASREIAICRELTKRFEEVLRGSAEDLAAQLQTRSLKGEIVVVIDRDRREASAESMDEMLKTAMANMSIKDAAATVSEALGLPRRQVYQAALEIAKS